MSTSTTSESTTSNSTDIEIQTGLNFNPKPKLSPKTPKTPKEMLESEVIIHLLQNREYFETVFPFLQPDYFNHEYSVIIKHIEQFYKKYQKSPNIKELIISFKDSTKQ